MKEKSKKRMASIATLYLTLIILISTFVMQVGIVHKGSDNDVESIESSTSLGVKEQEMEEISADIEVSPKNLELEEECEFTVFIQLPEPRQVSDIETDSVRCDGATPSEVTITDYNDGYLMAQFNTQELEEEAKNQGVLTVKGELTDGETYFEAEKVLS
ncbi:MAG: hypothetical protein R6U44_09290 [Archaeoglobaceae archaeon]